LKESTVLTATAAQILTLHAASMSGDGTYASATVFARSPLSVASQGPRVDVAPATTQRESRAQANALALLTSSALRHNRPNVLVRATSDDVPAFTSATQSSFAHVSDVSVLHLEGTVRCVHVIPPSWVASSSTWSLEVVAATRQSSVSVHDSAVTASPTVHAIGEGEDHVVAPSLVKESRELPAMPVASTTAHEAVAKQSRALTPRPARGAVATLKDPSLCW
jgi:hypothetical protein